MKINKLVRAGLVLFTSVGACLFLSFGLSGCPEAQVACQVVKAADEACTVIELVGVEGGAPERVSVSQEELRSFVRDTKARREALKRLTMDGGR